MFLCVCVCARAQNNQSIHAQTMITSNFLCKITRACMPKPKQLVRSSAFDGGERQFHVLFWVRFGTCATSWGNSGWGLGQPSLPWPRGLQSSVRSSKEGLDGASCKDVSEIFPEKNRRKAVLESDKAFTCLEATMPQRGSFKVNTTSWDA